MLETGSNAIKNHKTPNDISFDLFRIIIAIKKHEASNAIEGKTHGSINEYEIKGLFSGNVACMPMGKKSHLI